MGAVSCIAAETYCDSEGGGGGGAGRGDASQGQNRDCYYQPEVKRGVFEVGNIPVAILPSCQCMKTIALKLHSLYIVFLLHTFKV